MADNCPSKGDMQLVFKRLQSVNTNKVCFDCNAKNPTWASVTYGVFICIDCSAVHRSLGVHVTFVRSTQLDTNWTWLQLRQMQLGGNANALTFFRQHNCTVADSQQKYTSRAAQLYREKLRQMAIQAMRLHGTKLHLDTAPEHTEPEEKKEEDFFAATLNTDGSINCTEENEDHLKVQAPELSAADPAMSLTRGQPNVEVALSIQPDVAQQELRKPTIGGRKPQAKRLGLGAKKGGLGAQKVKANFADIEREAAMADQLKVQAAEEAKVMAERTAEEEQKQIASMRLAYQDLSLQQKKEQEKLKQVDPVKAQQVERLGMGFASRIGVSHSALSDMKTIEQESPSKAISSSAKSVFDRDSDRDGFFDDFRFSSPSSGFSMYKSSPSENKNLEAMFLDGNTSRDRCGSSKGWGSFEPENRQPSSSNYAYDDRPAPRRDPPSVSSSSVGNEAQKKFGSAKAISSEQFFGGSSDNSWERKANLSRFEGSSSISSAEYFGTGSQNSGGSSNLTTTDLEDVKESVRQGVTKVAGKLSSIANDVMSSIQDRYGY
ncbi:ADP-ribosylation factor GTPase-activating protein 2 [Cryptotermes secundus]|uniref:ADP-ribosylation factor GTPase-activating protein 2 n=1 Tax=Cryptotermes secundus TaxID=105785 RepID=A0A2J7PGE9_9NEOP|nr:ADP-ribosylation factor GTPase-activating protein 2 isoform X2 [Cryptotermes secundus]PNF15407.1 ADP-ribosylation factor GTPase-activating protein 2 [Cryptotermes secundus]